MISFLKKTIKNRNIKIILICFLTLFFVTAVWAVVNVDLEDGFRVNRLGSTVTVDIDNSANGPGYPPGYIECLIVQNDSTDKDYFIPTRTQAEWEAFKVAATTSGTLDADFTLSGCITCVETCPCGPSTPTGSTCTGDCGPCPGTCAFSCGSFTCGDYDGCGGTINCGPLCSGTNICNDGNCVPPIFAYFSDGANNTSQQIRFARTDETGATNDDLVYDKVTGLVWQKGHSSFGSNWNDALEYCEDLTLGVGTSYDNWRLPDRNELMSIVDFKSAGSKLIYEGTGGFSGTASKLWSSTTRPDNRSNAYYIKLDNGYTHYNSKSGSFDARCVR